MHNIDGNMISFSQKRIARDFHTKLEKRNSCSHYIYLWRTELWQIPSDNLTSTVNYMLGLFPIRIRSKHWHAAICMICWIQIKKMRCPINVVGSSLELYGFIFFNRKLYGLAGGLTSSTSWVGMLGLLWWPAHGLTCWAWSVQYLNWASQSGFSAIS